MKTKAVRIYGKNDLRLEEFELPNLRDDEILARVVSDSLCMSSYKAAQQGCDHKRIPKNINIQPTIIGHEFAGEIIEVGKKWQHKFSAGKKFSIQPALNYQDSLNAPGYSYPYIGGNATYIIIPNEVMEMDCLLEYNGKGFFLASLAEPMSCIIGAFHSSYHTKPGTYIHEMGIKKNGSMAILAGVGPMGLGAIDYALHCDRKPRLLIVTDIDDSRIQRAKQLFPPEYAQQFDVSLIYINTNNHPDTISYLRSLTNNKGFDDVFVFAPVKQVVEQADAILGFDGCLNFFAGPSNSEFKAELNFYNVHYAFTHLASNSGGNTNDMREALYMMSQQLINPAAMITHIGGLDAVIPTTLNLPNIPGGKKLIYTNIKLELTALADFKHKAKSSELFSELSKLIDKNNGIWSIEAEEFLLNNAEQI